MKLVRPRRPPPMRGGSEESKSKAPGLKPGRYRVKGHLYVKKLKSKDRTHRASGCGTLER